MRYATYDCKQSGLRLQRLRRLNVTPDHQAYRVIVEGDPCAYCGGRDHWRPRVTADHIVPVSVGGDLEWDNLTGACMACNSSKHDMPLIDFLLKRVAS